MEHEEVSRAILAAKQQIGMLGREINYQVSHGKANKKDLESSYSRLQQEISRARFVLRRLSTCLEAAGNDPADCAHVLKLQSLLENAVEERSRLYESVFGNQKRDSLKAFKESISDMIQRGIASSWIDTVTKEDLVNHGGEVNRLFQFLVEGQGNSDRIPLVDSLTLARASERVDLFSVKQCEALRKRSVEVDELMLKETERLVRNLEEDEEFTPFLRPAALKETTQGSITSGWVCDACTFRNSSGDVKCGACLASQGPSFLTVAKRKSGRIIAKPSHVGATKAVVIKKTPARGSTTNTLWIRNEAVPELIGPGGRNQKDLIKKTGALSIYAFQDKLDKDGMCPIEIQGGREVFDKVVEILEKKFKPKSSDAAKPTNNKSSEDATKDIIWIRNDDVPELIGPCGKTVQGLKTVTGVKSITAWQELVAEDGMCPIVIRGRPDAVKKAAASIVNMFCGVPDASRTYSSEKEKPKPPASSVVQGATKKLPAVEAAAIRPPTDTSTTSFVPPTAPRPFSGQPTHPAAKATTAPPDPMAAVAALKTTLGVGSGVSPLQSLLQENESCLTCSPADFYTWLSTVQASTLEDLAEALEDDDFVRLEMKANGLKYFKRFALQKSIRARLAVSLDKSPSPISTNSHSDPPFELLCPIRHALMTEDPVLAPDGYTYEREAIMEWIEREGDAALSPMTQEPLGDDSSLVSNVHIRTMARDWYRANKTD